MNAEVNSDFPKGYRHEVYKKMVEPFDPTIYPPKIQIMKEDFGF
jgi:hypothetical protein